MIAIIVLLVVLYFSADDIAERLARFIVKVEQWKERIKKEEK